MLMMGPGHKIKVVFLSLIPNLQSRYYLSPFAGEKSEIQKSSSMVGYKYPRVETVMTDVKNQSFHSTTHCI